MGRQESPVLGNGAISPSPIFDEVRPIQYVAAVIVIQVAFADHTGIIAVSATPIFDEIGPVQYVAKTIFVEIAFTMGNETE